MTDTSGGDAKNDYTFGQVAIRENLCSFDQVKECLDIQNKLRSIGIEPKKLGEILIEKGYLKPEQAMAIAKLQVQGAASTRIAIPGYEVISRIGQGAMGSVYKARQVSMDRIVAIKVLSSKYAKDKTFVDRFVREARAVARLNHENIIAGFDVGESGGVHYFVMEYVEGTPVSGILRKQGRLDERQCLEIGLQISRALSHAHKNGIVHRDVKPENIMITPANVAKLCDLGLAKQAKDDAGHTMDGMSVGTPNYISPEQARGEEKIDIRTDVYSLGASLYHMATGTTAFSGANAMVVMTKHVTEFPDPPKKRNPALSEGFNGLVMKMMEKRREDRYQDPDQLIAEMERLTRGEPAIALRSPAPVARPVTQVVRPEPAVVRPRTEGPASKPITHLPRLSPVRSSSSSLPVFIVVGILAAVGIAFFMAGGIPSQGGGGTNGPVKPVNPPPPVDPIGEADFQKEIASFRTYVDSRLVNPAIPDRYTAPFDQINERVEHYKARSKFSAQQAWEEELPQYTEKVNNLINTRIWADIEKKAREHYEGGRYGKALEELNRLEDVYKWFRKGEKPRMTAAGKAHAEWVRKINRDLSETYVNQKRLADEAFRDAARRDEAYRLLDGLAASATADQRAEIQATRRAFLDAEITELLSGPASPELYRKAQARIAQLRALHAGNPDVTTYLDKAAADLKDREQKISAGALALASGAYLAFQPKFAEAMKVRDLSMARRAANTLLFAPEGAAHQPAFLPQAPDAAVLRPWLDPARTAACAQLPQIVALSTAAAKNPTAPDPVREFYLDLRTTALLEELVEQALQGAQLAAKEPGRFKTGYSASLRDAVTVEPTPRRPESVSLSLTTRQGAGTATQYGTLAPRSTLVTEDDIVALARKAAPSDPLMPLKGFFINFFTGRIGPAKAYWDQLTTPELKLGTERYAEKFKGIASKADEEAARKLYEQAVDLYVRKKDTAGGIKLFRECLEKYGTTDYMKVKTSVGKSRTELIQERLK
jgi:serine/threonine-protein kinase